MITGIGALKGIDISGIGQLSGLSIKGGGQGGVGHRNTIIRKFGGKYKQVNQINQYIKEIARENKCNTFIELTGGGGRTIMNLPILEIDGNVYRFKEKIYNEYDRGLCNLFNCVKDKTKVKRLQDLLFRLGRSEDIFDYAAEHKSLKETPELLSAALTYIVAMQSWAGNGQSYLSGSTLEKSKKIGKEYFNKVKKLHLKSGILKDIKIINGDYKPLLKKYSGDAKVLKYIDPPYHPITRHQDGLDIYDLEWSVDDHKYLVAELVKSRSWILSGYDPLIWGCKDYLPLERAGAKKICLGVFRSGTNSTKTRKFNKEEYLWVMK